jgi:hypothetical protein
VSIDAAKTCLTCRWLSEPNDPAKWHECEWPAAHRSAAYYAVLERNPSLLWSGWNRNSINITRPIIDCPVHEERQPT